MVAAVSQRPQARAAPSAAAAGAAAAATTGGAVNGVKNREHKFFVTCHPGLEKVLTELRLSDGSVSQQKRS